MNEPTLAELQSAIASLARRPAQVVFKSRKPRTPPGNTVYQSGFTILYPADQVVLASGTATDSGTIDVSPYVPKAATMVLVRCRAFIDGNGDVTSIGIRPGTSGAYAVVADAGPGNSAGDSVTNTNTEWTMIEDRAFDFEVTGTNPDYSIVLVGYS